MHQLSNTAKCTEKLTPLPWLQAPTVTIMQPDMAFAPPGAYEHAAQKRLSIALRWSAFSDPTQATLFQLPSNATSRHH